MQMYVEELTPEEIALLHKRNLVRSDLVGQSKAANGGIAHCAYCRCQLSKSRIRISHVVPPAQGGTTDVKNVVLACPDCCKAKGGRTLKEWTERLNDQLDGVHSLITLQARKAKTAPPMDHCGAA